MKKILVLIILSTKILFSQVTERNLALEKWQFSEAGKNDFLPAKVPGTVHTDLYRNKKIPDPFFGENEKKLQWIEEKDWQYKTTFSVTEKEIQNQNIELIFNGLDTFAEVFLNGNKILDCNNMFRIWKTDVKNYLKIGNNELRLDFESSSTIGKDLAKRIPYQLPENERVFLRKAQYQFGWDWGPRFVTAGIWKPVVLKFWNTAKIENIKQSQSIFKNVADVDFKIGIKAQIPGNYNLEINDSKKTIHLKTGLNIIYEKVKIKNPKLWLPNGYGQPNLYDFNFNFSICNKSLDNKKLKIGIREIELVQIADDLGKGFYFVVNGKKVYAKGANTIPLHSFLPETTRKDIEKLISEAKFAHMNMLRVWGGGVYESADFYDLCDENGILVWQDFMFACAMYPGDENFLKNVKQEVIDQANRLQNHASLAIWCGNNEDDEGWHNWGWQKQFNYSKKDSAMIWSDYVKTFREMIPKILDSVSAQKPIYWQSSPKNGWGREIAYKEGDVHYWGVWWGMEPFEKYREKVGRFVSEYGFQGMPAMETFSKFLSMESLKQIQTDSLRLEKILFENNEIKSHQKHKTGYQTIQTYMARDYKIPKNFEDFGYVSQLLQARGMRIAIEAHRSSKPINMGTLYWQLNDCWPVTSWSSIDFLGKRKASHYQVKRSFEDTIFTFEEKAENYQIYAVSDLQYDVSGHFQFSLYDFNGRLLWNSDTTGKILHDAVEKKMEIPKILFENFDLNKVVLKIVFNGQNQNLSKLCFFEKPKDLVLEKPEILIKQIDTKTLEISTNTLVKDLNLISDEAGNFEDNFFDLLPGEKKTVHSELPIQNLRIKSLYDVQK